MIVLMSDFPSSQPSLGVSLSVKTLRKKHAREVTVTSIYLLSKQI